MIHCPVCFENIEPILAVMIVQKDFYLATAADIVADPSAPNAFVEGIMEGVEFWFDEQGNLHKESSAYEAMKNVERHAKRNALNEEKKLEIFQKYLDSILG